MSFSPGSRLHMAAQESFIRSSPNRSVLVHDNRYWNARQHRRKFARAAKRLEEDTIPKLGQDFYRNTARDVHAAKSHSLQCKISRHPAKYLSPEPQRLHTNGARYREAQLCNFTRCIAFRRFERDVAHRRVQEFVNPAEAPSGDNLLA